MDPQGSSALPLRPASGIPFPHRVDKPKRDRVTADSRSFVTNPRPSKPSRFSRHALPARPTFLPTDNGDLSWQFTKVNVTCFYWARGGCKKSDVNCHYAHFLTAIVADSPMAFGHGTGSKALGGKAGQMVIKDANDRDTELKELEARFAERQMAFNGEKVAFERQIKAMETRLQELELKAYELELRELEVERREQEVERREKEVQEREKAVKDL
ncbi:hypothetical protein LTR95_001693 [Oleoguttula sp. CCFEE 5521]